MFVVQCDNCQARYSVDLNRMKSRRAKATCHGCKRVIIIEKPPEPLLLALDDELERPEIWVLDGAPAVERLEVSRALDSLGATHKVLHLDHIARAATMQRLVRGNEELPSCIVFGDLHVILEDPLLDLLRDVESVARVLICTHRNQEILTLATEFCVVDRHIELPAQPREIRRAIAGVVASRAVLMNSADCA